MVLQEDVTVGVAEVRPVAILAIGHQGVPHLVVALIFQQLDAVEPVFHMISLHNHHSGVEVVEVKGLFVRRRDEIVERTQLAVTFYTQFGVGVIVVVKYLELASDGRTLAFVHIRVDKVLNSAVRTLGDLEIYRQDEVLILADGNNIATIG